MFRSTETSTWLQNRPAGDHLWCSASHIRVCSSWVAVSSPLDLPTDTFNPTDVIHRRFLDERIKADDPFCLALDCGERSDNIAPTWIVELGVSWPMRTLRRDDHGQR